MKRRLRILAGVLEDLRAGSAVAPAMRGAPGEGQGQEEKGTTEDEMAGWHH